MNIFLITRIATHSGYFEILEVLEWLRTFWFFFKLSMTKTVLFFYKNLRIVLRFFKNLRIDFFSISRMRFKSSFNILLFQITNFVQNMNLIDFEMLTKLFFSVVASSSLLNFVLNLKLIFIIIQIYSYKWVHYVVRSKLVN